MRGSWGGGEEVRAEMAEEGGGSKYQEGRSEQALGRWFGGLRVMLGVR